MAIANRVGKTTHYVLEADRELPEDQRTTWHIRSLSAREKAQIQDSLVGYEPATGTVTSRPGTATLVAVRMALVGWDNFRDADGLEVVPKSKKPKGGGPKVLLDSCLDLIAQPDLDELGAHVMELNGLDPGASRDDEDEEDAEEDAERPTAPGTGSPSSPPSSPET